MAQNGTKLKLTAKQREMAESLVNPDFDGSITELCQSLDVPRRTYYNWLDNPDFREYMLSLIDKYADSELAAVWKSLVKQATSGNVKAMKLFFELREKTNNGFGTQKADDDPLTKALKEEAERLDNEKN